MGYKDKPIIKLYKYENNSFKLSAIIDDYESCSFERNKYESGQFTIEINFNIPNALLFEKGLFVQFGNDSQDFGEIISIRDVIGSDGKGSQVRTIEGRDARYIFKRRIIKTLNFGSTYNLTGKGETVMRQLIADQCGANAETKRKLPIVNSGDTQLGKDYTLEDAYSNLYETLVTIATQSEIGWKVEFTNNQLVLGFYAGVDRSATVKFSTDYDSLADGTFEDSQDSYANAVYVGGKGNNEDRDIYEGESGSPNGLDRFECWDNQSSMTSDEEYENEALSVLSQYGQTINCDGRGLAQCPYIYKEQYNVGDIITIAFSGKSAKVQILSVTENWSKGQYNIDFSFGKPINDLSRQLQLILKKIHTADIEKPSMSTSSIRYYDIPDELIMPESDVTYTTIGFTGDIGSSNKTFKLFFNSNGTGAKQYHVYFKQLAGSGDLILTSGVSGKEQLHFKAGTYVAIIYVDSEGNVKCEGALTDSFTSPSTTWSSEKTQTELNTKANTSQIPTKTSQLTNDSGFWSGDNYTQLKSVTIDLRGFPSNRFYPIVFPATLESIECFIYKTGGLASLDFNANSFHAFFRAKGWDDTPHSYQILENSMYTTLEQSIMTLCRGMNAGTNAIYLRGNQYYQIRTTRVPTCYTSTTTVIDETWKAGILESELTSMGANTQVWVDLRNYKNKAVFSNYP